MENLFADHEGELYVNAEKSGVPKVLAELGFLEVFTFDELPVKYYRLDDVIAWYKAAADNSEEESEAKELYTEVVAASKEARERLLKEMEEEKSD